MYLLSVLNNSFEPQSPSPELKTVPSAISTIATMLSNINRLIECTSYPILTRIDGVLTYEAIKLSNNKLTRNVVIISKNLGNSTVRYARLTLTPAVYANICIHAWIPPVNPVIQAAISAI